MAAWQNKKKKLKNRKKTGGARIDAMQKKDDSKTEELPAKKTTREKRVKF